MRRAGPAAAALALATVAACGGSASPAATGPAARGGVFRAAFAAAPAHRLAGFSLDRDWLALAEDPARPGACPLVQLVRVPAGARRALTRPGGATCRFGGRFWVRPGGRALGNAIVKALWIVRNGSTAEAVKSSPSEPEVVLAAARGIERDGGPFLGPVVASNWLRLFASYTVAADGSERGGEISGNRRELWTADGPVAALGLDDGEHVVSVGADGGIAMWHAHGARYGRVPGAHARAAALDAGRVYVLRNDAPRLDVRLLSGRLVRSWRVAPGAAPLLDVDGGDAVYTAGGAVHELRLADGRDRVLARAPAGATLVDAQIERRHVAYAFRGGRAGRGAVVVAPR